MVAHGDTFPQQSFTAGAPQGGGWSRYCLIYAFIIFLSKYLIVVCFNMLMTLPCERRED